MSFYRSFILNRPAVILSILLIVVAGGWSFLQMPVALYPNTSKPEIEVRMWPQGMSSKEFQLQFADQIETSLRGLKGVEKVETELRMNRATFYVVFGWEITPDDAKQDVLSVINSAEVGFPKEWGRAYISYSSQNGSRFFTAVSSSSYSQYELAERLSQRLEASLAGIPGMAEVYFTLRPNREISIHVQPLRLIQKGINFSQIEQALRNSYLDSSLGSWVPMGGKTLDLNKKKALTSVEDLEDLVIKVEGMQTLYLRDVASVENKPDKGWGNFQVDGQPTLLVGGLPKPDANIKAVADEFFKQIDTQGKAIVPDLVVRSILNPATFINEAVGNVMGAIVLGVAITTIVVFLFFGILSYTLVICISIPLSLLGGFLLMKALGIEVNLISLGAMALAVGMVVDSSVVVLENIVRLMQDEKKSKEKIDRVNLVLLATKEVAVPVVVSVLTTVIVFFPLFYTAPLAAAILGDLALVVVCVLMFSLVVTFAIVPSLFLVVYREKEMGRKGWMSWASQKFQESFDRFTGFYSRTLGRFLLRPRQQMATTLLVCIALVGSFYLLATRVKREILAKPFSDKVFLSINFKDPLLSDDEKSSFVASKSREVKDLLGDDVLYTMSESGKGYAWILIFLKNKSRMPEVKKVLESTFKPSPMAGFYVDDWTPTSLNIPDPPHLQLAVSSANDKRSFDILDRIVKNTEGMSTIRRMQSNPDTNTRKSIEIISRKNVFSDLNQAGLNFDESAAWSQLKSYSAGGDLFTINESGKQYRVNFGIRENYWSSSQDILHIPIQVGDKVYPASHFFEVKFVDSSSEIYIVNGKQDFRIQLWFNEEGLGSSSKNAEQFKLKTKELLGDDYSFVHYEDTTREIHETLVSLAVCLAVSIGLVLFLVCLQMASFTRSMIVLSSAAFSFIGMALSIWGFGSTLGLNSMLGLILLGGTAVNNSIIFVDFFASRMSSGDESERLSSIIDTAILRFRPIMITTITTILGMLPIAFAMGSGGEILQPLGLAVSGGLFVSTCLTLYLVPMLLLYEKRIQYFFASFTSVPKFVKEGLGIKSSFIFFAILAASVFDRPLHAESPGVRDLSLESALEKAEEHSLGLKIAEKDLEVFAYKKRAHWASLLPHLSIDRTMSEQRMTVQSNREEPWQDLKVRSSLWKLRLSETVQEPLTLFGRGQIADLRIQLASIKLGQERVRIRNAVRRSYYALSLTKINYETAQDNLKLAEDNESQVEKRFRNGEMSEADFLRASMQARSSLSSLRGIEGDLRVRQAELAQKIGLSENEFRISRELPSSFSYFSKSKNSESVESPSCASPELSYVQSQRISEEIARKNFQVSRLGFLPTLTMAASYEWQDPKETSPLYLETKRTGPLFEVGLSWEIFSGGRSYYEYREAVASMERDSLSSSSEKKDVCLEQASLEERLAALKEEYLFSQESLEMQRRIFESTKRLYDQGRVTSLQQAQDLEVYLKQKFAVAQKAFDILRAVSELVDLTGRDELWAEYVGE